MKGRVWCLTQGHLSSLAVWWPRIKYSTDLRTVTFLFFSLAILIATHIWSSNNKKENCLITDLMEVCVGVYFIPTMITNCYHKALKIYLIATLFLSYTSWLFWLCRPEGCRACPCSAPPILSACTPDRCIAAENLMSLSNTAAHW